MQPIKQTSSPFWNKIGLGVLLLCVCVGFFRWVFTPDQDSTFRPVTIADLKGVWETDNPNYQDRFLQFDNNTITFGWGPEGQGAYAIEKIDSEPGMEGTLVRVRYHDLAGTDYHIRFWYVDQDGGLLRMKNQEGIDWFHSSDQPSHSPEYQ